MTRKQKKMIFWVSVVSLNLVPLVAYGFSNPHKVGGQKPAPKKVTYKPKPKKPSNTVAPAAPEPAPEPARPAADTGPSQFLGIAELTGGAFKNFEVHKEGAEPNSVVRLYGQVYNDCKDKLEIIHQDNVSCTKVAKGAASAKADDPQVTAAAFVFKDSGGFMACMKRKAAEGSCTPDTCTQISADGGGLRGARYPLAAVGAETVMILRHDPDANELHGNLCEDFTTTITHISAQAIAAKKISDDETDKQSKIDLAKEQIKNCLNSESELRIAYSACAVLASFGVYDSKEACIKTENIEGAEFDLLKNRVGHAAKEDLPTVAAKLGAWAKKHPRECRKAIGPLHLLAKRLATQKVKKQRHRGRDDFDDSDDSDSDPTQGYTDAIDALQVAVDAAPCLDDDGKITAMQDNLLINQTEKIGELKGLYSMEYQTQYADLIGNVQNSIADSCSSWEMDPSCSAAMGNMRSLASLNQAVQSSNMRTMQAQQTLCSMITRSSNGFVPQQCQAANPFGINIGGFGYGFNSFSGGGVTGFGGGGFSAGNFGWGI